MDPHKVIKVLNEIHATPKSFEEELDTVMNDCSSREAAFNSKTWNASEKRQAAKEWQAIRDESKQAILSAHSLDTKRQVLEELEQLEIQHEPLLCNCRIMNHNLPARITQIESELGKD